MRGENEDVCLRKRGQSSRGARMRGADSACPPCHARGGHGARCAFAPPYGTARGVRSRHTA